MECFLGMCFSDVEAGRAGGLLGLGGHAAHVFNGGPDVLSFRPLELFVLGIMDK